MPSPSTTAAAVIQNESDDAEEEEEEREGEEDKNVGSRPRGGKAELRRLQAVAAYYSSTLELKSDCA